MSHAISTTQNPKITNILQYVRSKTARQNTGLINGEIVLDGMVFDEETYNELFPVPVLIYDIVNLDGKQISKS